MDRILRYEKKFIKIYTYSLCIVFLFILFSLIKSIELSSVVYIGVILIFSFYIINIVLYYFNFFNISYFFIGLKYIGLWLLSIFFYNDNLFVFGTSVFFYIFISVEIVLVLNQSKKTKHIYMFLTFLPMLVISIIYLKGYFFNHAYLFFILEFLVHLFGIFTIIEISNVELKEQINKQIDLRESSQKANEKVQIVYQQMSKQKAEIEQANKELNRITGEMYIQNELLRYISSTLEIETLMDLVTDAITGALGVDTCSVIIHDIYNDKYLYKSKSCYPVNQIIDSLKTALAKGQLKEYFNNKNSHMDSNVELIYYPFITGRQVGSIVIMPLTSKSEVYGLMISEHASKGFFAASSLEFFGSIATQITIAVNNANLYAKMEEIATKDGLTGIYNRRHLQKKIEESLLEIKEKNGVLSISLFDIDKFKKINDTYGHLFGDEAIKMVAHYAEKYAQDNGGFAGRYGGEEFVVALPNINLDKTIKIMEQMHADIKKEALYYSDDVTVYINISMGITEFPGFGKGTEDLLKRADNAMYYSKEHGRGKITVDSNELKKLL